MNYDQAKKRVEAIKGYYIHLALYIGVTVFLFVVDYFNKGNWWFFWPMIGWGVAIVIHTIAFFFDTNLFGKDWEDRKIKEMMDKQHIKA